MKLLKDRVKYSRFRIKELREQVKEYENEFHRMRAENQQLHQELNDLKENVKPGDARFVDHFGETLPFHTYSIGHIQLFLSLVLSASTSLRGTSKSLEIVFKFFGIQQRCPSFQIGRLWLLRLGLYKLTRPKEHANDWIWIIDHTVQLGDDKCLLILGIRQSCLPKVETYLAFEDMEPIALIPVKHSNGQVVYQQLEETVARTGVPREICSDYGGDVKSGIESFCAVHSETCFIYDIKHKGATVLKAELKNDEVWAEFIKFAAETRNKVQQTPLAQYMPPNQRSKARYMNLGELLDWG
ncbi:MAG: hypothetical protein GY816_22810, partial [Cytophagales bacterium]|nr:hypothetical protein [Cytophagales bacterium]